jgi:ABC-type sugar transport system substrate-binding protein
MTFFLKRGLVFFCLYCTGQTSATELQEKCLNSALRPQVVLAIPAPKHSGFWDDVAHIAQAASKQLNIDLKVHYFDENSGKRFTHLEFIDRILTEEAGADYLVSSFVTGTEKGTLKLAKKHKVQLFSFDSPLTQELEAFIGKPRTKYPAWIGHVSTDQMKTGYDLANFIIKKNQQEKEPINLLAFIGSNTSHLNEMRVLGLQSSLQEHENITLLQIVKTDWTYKQTRKKMSMLFNRFSDIDIIWCASDTIASAVVDEIKKSKPEMLNGVVIGSIDWSQNIIPYLTNNDVDVSYGGHIFDIAHLLVLLYDYHNGLDFKSTLGTVIKNINNPLSAENINFLEATHYDKLNFTHFSQCHSSKGYINKYSAHELLNKLPKQPL